MLLVKALSLGLGKSYHFSPSLRDSEDWQGGRGEGKSTRSQMSSRYHFRVSFHKKYSMVLPFTASELTSFAVEEV